ncbi:MAG: lytic transglycosylase domain-containing protein [Zhaonellaceae bacterium]|jgi:soluble lytic murein transglycosylase|nr:lytic transglycosylase domain-containing protein [Clostridia bacterium]
MNSKRFTLIISIIFLSFLIIIIPWFWRIFYPYPYRESILSHANEFSLPPNLVVAVARVESKFRPNAVSPRGAKGIMQLMPETAQWIASQMNIDYKEDRLFDPDYNIRLGCWYLAYLLHDFQGSLPAALAAYNSGKSRVKQWISNKIWDGSLDTLSQIPYKETRDFVERVVHDLKMYNILY